MYIIWSSTASSFFLLFQGILSWNLFKLDVFAVTYGDEHAFGCVFGCSFNVHLVNNVFANLLGKLPLKVAHHFITLNCFLLSLANNCDFPSQLLLIDLWYWQIFKGVVVVFVWLYHFFFKLVYEQLHGLEYFVKQSIKRIYYVIAGVSADFKRPQIQLAVQLLDVIFADCSIAEVLFVSNQNDRDLFCFFDVDIPLVNLFEWRIVVQSEYEQYAIEVTHVALRKWLELILSCGIPNLNLNWLSHKIQIDCC